MSSNTSPAATSHSNENHHSQPSEPSWHVGLPSQNHAFLSVNDGEGGKGIYRPRTIRPPSSFSTEPLSRTDPTRFAQLSSANVPSLELTDVNDKRYHYTETSLGANMREAKSIDKISSRVQMLDNPGGYDEKLKQWLEGTKSGNDNEIYYQFLGGNIVLSVTEKIFSTPLCQPRRARLTERDLEKLSEIGALGKEVYVFERYISKHGIKLDP
ncbi:uncharacterized protein L201_007680 [Kwoniella dendrophila CBS 6074]|uniref:Ras modification protein ERF4 n=1 Tax=Kwoniella dendrophila CBS 6074 TaxID=1295534 RepID=A0AAX4K521_9TREE